MPRSETAKQWRERLQRFAASQLTVAQFCLSEGVSQPSFYKWRKKLRELPADVKLEASTPDVQFLPLRLATEAVNQVASKPDQQASPAVACTTIELPGGVRIRVEAPVTGLPGQSAEDRT